MGTITVAFLFQQPPIYPEPPEADQGDHSFPIFLIFYA